MDSEKLKNSRESVPKSTRPKRWRRAIVTSSLVCGMLFSGLVTLPTAVMNTAYRNSLLNSRLQKHGLTAESKAGSGSWLTPIQFHDITIEDATGRARCTVRSIRTSKSLLSLILNGGDLGTLTLVEPRVSLELDDDGNLPEALTTKLDESSAGSSDRDMRSQPNVAFVVQDAAFVLTAPWRRIPVVDIDQLNISGSVATDGDGRWLTLEPIQIFDREPLSDAHTEQNLALIAPILSQTTQLQGDVSIQLDGVRYRLDGNNRGPFPIAGSATFHTVEARLKKDWAVQVSQLVGHVAGQPVPDRLQIVRDSSVTFHVDDQGVHHQGLAFLLPELGSRLRIESSGLVGLDEHLDLSFRLHLPQVLPGGGLFTGLMSKMLSGPMTLSVKGTISEPKLEAPPGFSIVDQMSRNLGPDQQDIAAPVTQSIINVISSAAAPDADAGKQIASGIFNIVRAAKEAKEANQDASAKEPRPRRERRRKRL